MHGITPRGMLITHISKLLTTGCYKYSDIIKMSLKEFEILKELGKGAYGCVYKVRRVIDLKIYALKKVELSKLSKKEKENALNEIRLLASIDSTYIVSYKDAFFDNESEVLCIVMEFVDDGDLESKISENTKQKRTFCEALIWEFLYQIAQGLKALHDKKIMHRDLKSANIFINKNKEVKIGDMNISKVFKVGVINTQTGTPYYASPEIWNNKPYDYKSDIWSVGCIVFEMCTNRPPFRGSNMNQIYVKINKGHHDLIPLSYSKTLRNLISSMLQVFPFTRPSVDQILMIANANRTKLGETAELVKPQFDLLKTIRLPKNLREINKSLPQNKYQRIVKR